MSRLVRNVVSGIVWPDIPIPPVPPLSPNASID